MNEIRDQKILFLVTQSKYGGAQKYVLQLAEHLIQHNTVLIAVGEKDNRDEYFFEEARKLGIEPIVLKSLIRDVSIVKGFDAVLEIRKLLIKERPDIFHINSSMAGALGSCGSWLYGFDPLTKIIRVVYTAHGFVFNEPLPTLKKKMYLTAEKISASWKGAIITVSDYDKQQALQHKIAPAKKISVIHNGIDTSLEFLSRDQAREKLGLPKDGIVIGTIGSYYKTKGHEYLIDAADQISGKASIVIIGNGPEQQHLQKRIEEKKVNDTIRLLEMKHGASQYLKAFDVFVMSSVKEGLPYTILEAGLAQLPVVTTNVGGIPEIITNQEHGTLVAPENPAELAHALLHYIEEPETAKRHARALHTRIATEFSLKKMLSETEELYSRFYKK